MDFPELYPVCDAWMHTYQEGWIPCLRLAENGSDYCEIHHDGLRDNKPWVSRRRPATASADVYLGA